MSEPDPDTNASESASLVAKTFDAKTWLAGVLFLGFAAYIGYTLPHPPPAPAEQSVQVRGAPKAGAAGPATRRTDAAFTPVPDDQLPTGDFGDMVRLGERIFEGTAPQARPFIGNDLRCASCHLDRGRQPHSAPMWAAYLVYPAYRSKNEHVNSFAERLQGCFRYSMNGKAPPFGDEVLVALESYAYALAKGAPTGAKLPGQGYPKLPKPEKLDRVHGAQVYAQKCALCHGPTGEGQKTAEGHVVFPPLWGARSYNWGAGMSVISNAAGFIKANMPLSQGNTLTDQEAWDVAAFIDGQERPQDPRFQGSVAETRRAHHDNPMDLYGTVVDGVMLGETSPPSGTVPR